MTVRALLGAALLALAGCGADDRGTTRRAAGTDAAYPPIGRLVDVGDGRQVHAYVTGSGPDVVLIHGASGNVRDWTFRVADRLSDRYRVIALDRPGLGYTDRAGPSYEGAFTARAESPAVQAEMLSQAARALGAERPLVVGHSYGGAVAMAWGLDRPAAGLVVVSGATMPWPGGLGPQYAVLGSSVGGAVLAPAISAVAGRGIVDRAVQVIFAPQPVPEGYVDHLGVALTLRPPTLRANARQINTLRPHVVEMSRRYPTLDLPVEIVHGDADEIVPPDIHARPLAEVLPDARLTMLPGIGHMPHQVAPDAVVAAIDRAARRAGLR
ncbi:alpha/beta fold hydrolase [Roseivivax isoporae]|uniref:Alpha/beta hydrolase n=1 Tax=Roseivivax isoporae LMG 25204 TaxID=1449351 RepID=X7F5T8_9RHOB|nr:alpha/beta hydrolase [Roseivivax isoporae]ETX28292.1 alpha/beta hydrolase [Roseivivax isoporae LMG 25204]